ncbi:MAG: hypothetical protein SGPRY_005641, partial [Prymnesium sp.]
EAVLVLAHQLMLRRSASPDATGLLYFEVFVKTPGGGAQPSGSIAVGLAESKAEGLAESQENQGGSSADSDITAPRRFLHYHSSKGTKADIFPRRTSTTSRPCGPSFSSGVCGF